MDKMRRAYQRLQAAAESGRLEELCAEYGVSLLVGFGSVISSRERPPRDIDLAFRFENPGEGDLLGFMNALMGLSQIDEIDLMDLSRAGPVAREQALAHGDVLVERHVGDFAEAQMAAITERMDTAWLRRIELEQLAQWQ